SGCRPGGTAYRPPLKPQTRGDPHGYPCLMALDPRRTKILATIGPSSGDRDRLPALVDAGMDAARLNFSHATHDQHRAWADLIRTAGDDAGRPLALVADLHGPKLRVGDLERPRLLSRGE